MQSCASFHTLLEEERVRAFNLSMSCKIHGTYLIFFCQLFVVLWFAGEPYFSCIHVTFAASLHLIYQAHQCVATTQTLNV